MVTLKLFLFEVTFKLNCRLGNRFSACWMFFVFFAGEGGGSIQQPVSLFSLWQNKNCDLHTPREF